MQSVHELDPRKRIMWDTFASQMFHTAKAPRVIASNVDENEQSAHAHNF